jgi:hypothetical protein
MTGNFGRLATFEFAKLASTRLHHFFSRLLAVFDNDASASVSARRLDSAAL